MRGEKRCGKGKQVPPFQRSQGAPSRVIVVRRRERAREAQASDCDEAGRKGDAYRSAQEPWSRAQAQEPWSRAQVSVLCCGGAVKLHTESPCPGFPFWNPRRTGSFRSSPLEVERDIEWSVTRRGSP